MCLHQQLADSYIEQVYKYKPCGDGVGVGVGGEVGSSGPIVVKISILNIYAYIATALCDWVQHRILAS